MINFGKYDQKVSFISYQLVDDGYGGTTPSASVLITTFARVEQIRAFDGVESNQMVLPNTYRIAIQYRSSFTPSESMVIYYRNAYHKITGVALNHQRQQKEFIITMVTTDALLGVNQNQNSLDSSLDFTI